MRGMPAASTWAGRRRRPRFLPVSPSADVFRMAASRGKALISLHRRGRCPAKRRRAGRGITPAKNPHRVTAHGLRCRMSGLRIPRPPERCLRPEGHSHRRLHARLEGDAACMRAGGHSFCLVLFIQCMGRRLSILSPPPLHEGTIHLPVVLRPLAILALFYEGVKRIHAPLGRASRARRGEAFCQM